MENATKALLIAAGVIVAILIISLGMMIYNNSSSSNDDASKALNSLQITQFNQRYEQYEGIRSGSIVKKILDYAMDDNKYLNETRNPDDGINLRSNITEMINAFPEWGDALTTRSYGVMYSSNISRFRDKIKTSKKYKVWYVYGKNGLINEIHIDNAYNT